MAVHAAQPVPQLACTGVGVVDAADERILKRNAPAGRLKIVAACLQELLHRIDTRHGHGLRTDRIVRRVQRNRQIHRQSALCQFIDFGNDAAGRERDMTHADMQSLLAAGEMQKPNHVVKVVERLPHSHQHHIGDAHAFVALRRFDLCQHFRGGQAPRKAAFARCAEGATHLAAHLRGDADGISMVIGHQHSLNTFAVVKRKKVLHCFIIP